VSGPRPDPAPPAQCTLAAAERDARLAELRRDFLPRVRGARELPDGVALLFAADPETARAVADFVAFERGCCGFARYEVDAQGGELWLEIRGPREGGALLQEIVRSWLGPGAAAPDPAEPNRPGR
jgi:hypothetical protein